MKKNLLFLFFFIQINLVVAQKDTLKIIVHKGYSVNEEKVEQSPYRIFMSAGGLYANPVMAFIDTASIKTQKDSLKAEIIAKTYFLDAQKDYFNMIYKKSPDFSGLDFSGKMLNHSDFNGKKTIVYFFSASTQLSFDRLETVKRLYEKYASKSYRFVVVSPQSREELMQYAMLKALPYPVLGQQDYIFSTYCKNIAQPFFTIADEKGIVQKVFAYPTTSEGRAAPLEPEEEVFIDFSMPPKDLEIALNKMNTHTIWVKVKNVSTMMKDKDYFWTPIDAYLSGH